MKPPSDVDFLRRFLISPCESLPANLSLLIGKERYILRVEGVTVTVCIVPFQLKCMLTGEIKLSFSRDLYEHAFLGATRSEMNTNT